MDLPHQTLWECRKFVEEHESLKNYAPVPFLVLRNPFDFHIAFWVRELQMGRFKGCFADYLLNYNSHYYCWSLQDDDRAPGCRMWDHFKHMGGQEIEHIGQLEYFLPDLVQILCELDPSLMPRDIDSLFPEAYMANYGLKHLALQEQYMRKDLYTTPLIDYVYEHDWYFFERWDYSFESVALTSKI